MANLITSVTELAQNNQFRAKIRKLVQDEAKAALKDQKRAKEHGFWQHVTANPNKKEWLDKLAAECAANPNILSKYLGNKANFPVDTISEDVLFIARQLDKQKI